MAKDTRSQIIELEARLQELKAAQIEELKERLKQAQKTVSDLEQEIANISGKVLSQGRRKRTSSAEVERKIHAALDRAKEGLSQKEISDASGINYGTVVLFLRKNQKDFRSTGKFKSKRYFLK